MVPDTMMGRSMPAASSTSPTVAPLTAASLVPAHSRAWANSNSRAKRSDPGRSERHSFPVVLRTTSRDGRGGEAVLADGLPAGLAGGVGALVEAPEGAVHVLELELDALEQRQVSGAVRRHC